MENDHRKLSPMSSFSGGDYVKVNGKKAVVQWVDDCEDYVIVKYTRPRDDDTRAFRVHISLVERIVVSPSSDGVESNPSSPSPHYSIRQASCSSTPAAAPLTTPLCLKSEPAVDERNENKNHYDDDAIRSSQAALWSKLPTLSVKPGDRVMVSGLEAHVHSVVGENVKVRYCVSSTPKNVPIGFGFVHVSQAQLMMDISDDDDNKNDESAVTSGLGAVAGDGGTAAATTTASKKRMGHAQEKARHRQSETPKRKSPHRWTLVPAKHSSTTRSPSRTSTPPVKNVASPHYDSDRDAASDDGSSSEAEKSASGVAFNNPASYDSDATSASPDVPNTPRKATELQPSRLSRYPGSNHVENCRADDDDDDCSESSQSTVFMPRRLAFHKNEVVFAKDGNQGNIYDAVVLEDVPMTAYDGGRNNNNNSSRMVWIKWRTQNLKEQVLVRNLVKIDDLQRTKRNRQATNRWSGVVKNEDTEPPSAPSSSPTKARRYKRKQCSKVSTPSHSHQRKGFQKKSSVLTPPRRETHLNNHRGKIKCNDDTTGNHGSSSKCWAVFEPTPKKDGTRCPRDRKSPSNDCIDDDGNCFDDDAPQQRRKFSMGSRTFQKNEVVFAKDGNQGNMYDAVVLEDVVAEEEDAPTRTVLIRWCTLRRQERVPVCNLVKLSDQNTKRKRRVTKLWSGVMGSKSSSDQESPEAKRSHRPKTEPSSPYQKPGPPGRRGCDQLTPDSTYGSHQNTKVNAPFSNEKSHQSPHGATANKCLQEEMEVSLSEKDSSGSSSNSTTSSSVSEYEDHENPPKRFVQSPPKSSFLKKRQVNDHDSDSVDDVGSQASVSTTPSSGLGFHENEIVFAKDGNQGMVYDAVVMEDIPDEAVRRASKNGREMAWIRWRTQGRREQIPICNLIKISDDDKRPRRTRQSTNRWTVVVTTPKSNSNIRSPSSPSPRDIKVSSNAGGSSSVQKTTTPSSFQKSYPHVVSPSQPPSNVRLGKQKVKLSPSMTMPKKTKGFLAFRKREPVFVTGGRYGRMYDGAVVVDDVYHDDNDDDVCQQMVWIQWLGGNQRSERVPFSHVIKISDQTTRRAVRGAARLNGMSKLKNASTTKALQALLGAGSVPEHGAAPPSLKNLQRRQTN